MNARGFRINSLDNVATLVDDVAAGASVVVLTDAGQIELNASEAIARGHKIALADLAVGEPVVKFGARIGVATTRIARGAWVHLHNCASVHDARSGTLDLHTGAPTDQADAYI